MKKTQTFLAVLEDENKKHLTFERFAYKKIETVIRSLAKLYSTSSSWHFLYKAEIEKAAHLVVYATPDPETRIERLRIDKPALLSLISH
jgi:hypothetical protein